MVPERIEREVVIDAPILVVWSVVTEPKHIGGRFSDSAEVELRPGGELRFTWDEHGTGDGTRGSRPSSTPPRRRRESREASMKRVNA
ncbi:MAG TPA: SRPBCC domain-containing protein [Solirubrobacteraceae bacterium]|nr:SRPBCC domain-containing protein [Solirubrobacteraceae bacterium]